MKISQLPKKRGRLLFALWLALFTAWGGVKAQEPAVEFLQAEVMIGDTFYYEFQNIPPYNPHLVNYTSYPKYGQAGFPFSGPLGAPDSDTLGYVPTVNYPVIDTVYFKFWTYVNGYYNTATKIIEISVVPGIVHAEDDYAETTVNTPVDIDVLFNDYTNIGLPKIAEVPLTYLGSVSLSSDSTMATFTPEPDFVGIAHFNYTIEGANNTFDAASVNIAVRPANEPLEETYELSTPKETALALLYSLDGYHLAQAPAHGAIDSLAMDYPVYTPEAGFYDDQDTIVYEKTVNGLTFRRTFIVDVMNLPLPNTFAFDDFAYTTVNQSVLIDVRANDFNNSGSVPIVVQPQHGTVTYQGSGVYEYVPDPDFAGNDKFVYRSTMSSTGVTEYASVYVTVSDYLPAQGTFPLTTPKNTPLVIAYNIPVHNYDFTITVNPIYGTAEFFPGNQTLTINGQTFSGYNMLIYTPDPGVAGVTDEFEIEYCVSSANCPTAQIKVDVNILDIDPPASHFCVEDHCIWAGDANNDGAVTMEDLLPLGIAMGEVGAKRDQPNLDTWYGQYGDDWQVPYNLPYNLKFADTDGDGIISAEDTLAISRFYLNKHSLVPAPTAPPINVPLYFFQTSQTPVTGGDLVHLDIWLGKPDAQLAEDIYGFTFSMQYEADVVPEESVHIDFLPQSWVTYNSPALYMTQKPYLGRIDAGFTRTSGYSDDGYGIVATMEFIIIEDIDGTRLRDQYLDIYLTGGTIMTASGQTYSVPDQHLKIPLDLASGSKTGSLVAWPNPATDEVRLHLNGDAEDSFAEITLSTATGREILHLTQFEEGSRDERLDLSNLPGGIYIIKALTTKGEMRVQKLEVVR